MPSPTILPASRWFHKDSAACVTIAESAEELRDGSRRKDVMCRGPFGEVLAIAKASLLRDFAPDEPLTEEFLEGINFRHYVEQSLDRSRSCMVHRIYTDLRIDDKGKWWFGERIWPSPVDTTAAAAALLKVMGGGT